MTKESFTKVTTHNFDYMFAASIGIFMTAVGGWQFALVGILCSVTARSIICLYKKEKYLEDKEFFFMRPFVELAITIGMIIPYLAFNLFWINMVTVFINFMITNYYLTKLEAKE